MKKVIFSLCFTLFLFAIITKATAGELAYCDQKGDCWYKNDEGDLYDDHGHYLYKQKNTAADTMRIMVEMGAVPAGATPKKIFLDEGDQIPHYAQTDPLSNAARGLNKYQKEQEERYEKELDQQGKAIKLYKEMVDAGYTPMQAWESTLKDFGYPPPTESKETFGFVPEK